MAYTIIEYADQISTIDFDLSEIESDRIAQTAAEEFLKSVSC